MYNPLLNERNPVVINLIIPTVIIDVLTEKVKIISKSAGSTGKFLIGIGN